MCNLVTWGCIIIVYFIQVFYPQTLNPVPSPIAGLTASYGLAKHTFDLECATWNAIASGANNRD